MAPEHGALRLQMVRKERAVGAIPQVPTVYEVLEEMAITVSCCLPHQHTARCTLEACSHRSVDQAPLLLCFWWRKCKRGKRFQSLWCCCQHGNERAKDGQHRYVNTCVCLCRCRATLWTPGALSAPSMVAQTSLLT